MFANGEKQEMRKGLDTRRYFSISSPSLSAPPSSPLPPLCIIAPSLPFVCSPESGKIVWIHELQQLSLFGTMLKRRYWVTVKTRGTSHCCFLASRKCLTWYLSYRSPVCPQKNCTLESSTKSMFPWKLVLYLSLCFYLYLSSVFEC